MFIYDYCNEAYELEINPDYVKRIHAVVVTGDEVLTIYYTNGAIVAYDASRLLGAGRMLDDVDCEYDITERDNIRRFMEYKPSKACDNYPIGKIISIERAKLFGARLSSYAE